jgi:hypothetical protein
MTGEPAAAGGGSAVDVRPRWMNDEVWQ